MFSKKSLSWGLLALVLTLSGGCQPRLLPAVPAGLTLQPGRYLKEDYRAPGFVADQVTYTLAPFTVAQAQNIPADTFQSLLQAELARAWEANGLKVAPQGDVVLVGTVQLVRVNKGLRFLVGRISADLLVSGAITRGEQVLFAFQDRIHVASPVNPGPPAPKENELLLQQVIRNFSDHLLTELLLH